MKANVGNVIAAVFPYMMSEVDHLGIFLANLLKICQDGHPIGISCYKHVYTCSCAFVSSLFPRE